MESETTGFRADDNTEQGVSTRNLMVRLMGRQVPVTDGRGHDLFPVFILSR